MDIKTAVSVASELVKTPHQVSLNGRSLSYEMLVSPMAGMSILGYLTESLSYSLFDESKVGFALKIDKSAMTGLKLIEDINLGANDILLLASGIEQLVGPALADKNFDYSDLFLSFRDILLATHTDGDKIDVQQPLLVSHLHETLRVGLQQSGIRNTHSPDRGFKHV